MSTSIMKVFLLLAVVVRISQAQHSKQCLCSHVRRLDRFDIKDVQIFQATVYCNRVEIVVTTNSGYRYCLDPKRKPVQQLVASIMNRQKASTASPTTFSSTPGSSSRSTQQTPSVTTGRFYSQQSLSPELGSGKQCLCSSVRRFGTSDIKDVQIYPANILCSNLEIVVTTNSGDRYCLDPKRRMGLELVANIT